MKRKSLILTMTLSILLVMALLLSACGGASLKDEPKDSVLKLYSANAPEIPTFSSISAQTINGDIAPMGTYGVSNTFFISRKIDDNTGNVTYYVYDTASVTSIFSISDTVDDDIQDVEIYLYNDYFTVTVEKVVDEETVTTTELRNKAGAVVATAEGDVNPIESTLFNRYGLFYFDGSMYALKDGVITLVADELVAPSDSDIPQATTSNDEYYWVKTNNRYVAYDINLKVAGEYVLPSYATDVVAGAMKGDKLFVQYSVEVDPESTEYDYFDGTNKYNLYQFVYSIKNDKATEVDYGGYVGFVSPATESKPTQSFGEYRLNFGDNIAIMGAYRIENKRINSAEPIYCTINKDNAISATYSVPSNLSMRAALADDRFLVLNNYTGNYQIVDSKEKVYGEFKYSAFNNTSNSYNTSFIIVDGDLYDFDFNLVYEAKDNSIITLTTSGALIKEMDEDNIHYRAYLVKAGDTEIGSALVAYTETNNAQISISSFQRMPVVTKIVDGEISYSYYNQQGTLLKTTDDPLTYVASTADASVVIFSSVDGEGETVYYVMR